MIAYIVTSYHLPEQTVRLVEHLAGDADAIVLVHHDRQADDASWRALQRGLSPLSNVVLLPRRVCRYATFDHVRVQIDALEWMVEHDLDIDHALMLTGQCYPIKPMAQIRAHLAKLEGRTVMSFDRFPHPAWPDGGYARLNTWVLPLAASKLPGPVSARLPKRQGWVAVPKPSLIRYRLGGSPAVRPPRGTSAVYGGVGYWAMAGEHVRYVYENHRRFVPYFRYSYNAESMFFQTILMNSPHAGEIDNDLIHLVDWSREREPAGIHPYVWRATDLEEIRASDKPFGRKFDVTRDREVLDLIDEQLLQAPVKN